MGYNSLKPLWPDQEAEKEEPASGCGPAQANIHPDGNSLAVSDSVLRSAACGASTKSYLRQLILEAAFFCFLTLGVTR